MAKSSQLTVYKLFNSLLFLILTVASLSLFYMSRILDSIQSLLLLIVNHSMLY